MKSTSRTLTVVALALVGSLVAASPAAAALGLGGGGGIGGGVLDSILRALPIG
ncbi:hypothetical protein [Nocardiopsis quinghaiensis]|uniref:hypothetical protein n=1 Tax=Nocardiopsis quinghaiensis TaxID=464995 RepID=UPI0016807B0B|nr:hypothetical protein [Nocardiopsis quinghaiensis]